MRCRVGILLSLFVVISFMAAPAAAQSQDQSSPISSLKMSSSLAVSPFATDLQSAAVAPPQSSGHSQGFGIGAKVGPLFSSLNDPAYSNRTGLIGGLWFGGNRNGVVGVMGELLYAKKGANLTNASTNVDLYYLEIPVLLRINIGSGSASGARVYGLVGPSVDVLLKGKQNDIDVKDNYESVDVGLKFGIGVEYLRMLIEAQENIGLRNVLKVGDAGGVTEVKNKTFAILVGVRFN
jgi:outer membrane protein with beta-barrel domain